ncbi:MAG TPA: MgtC/SapB family protein [Edaphobacter sp.]|nr:MgtC/SapB family protein [Edaphobacter sp.]
MPISLTWQQIAVRIALALIASFLIGYDRDEHGKTAGIRTTMLVCLAATLAMLQANLLMNSTGKASSSFVVLDLMRLPLGILSGIGFIGAGAILRKDGLVHGLTTAATLWFITVLGLLFGGGQLILGVVSTALAFFILWALKQLEHRMTVRQSGTLYLELRKQAETAQSIDEAGLRSIFHQGGFSISNWNAQYTGSSLNSLTCDLHWTSSGKVEPSTPPVIRELTSSPSVATLTWKA